MNIGDLVWCIYHIYLLPEQGIIIKIYEDMDIYYEVLIDGEKHTLPYNEVYLKQTDALQYQMDILRTSADSKQRK